ncbi:M1 family metallopeptidase [Sulfurifustis variabilis]|uniref:M1 family metallopeptidase n=1 Tax=Sulfurifustis variabilis TaxID=1675686 RepID=UPI000BBA4FED|nr:M1 family aminopeptidase [Sulfurifustis variabilis]
MRAIALCALLCAAGAASAETPPVVRHALTVALSPERGHLAVRDEITLPAGFPRPLSFLLDGAFEPRAEEPGARLHGSPVDGGPRSLKRYTVELPPDRTRLTLVYAGRLPAPVDLRAMPAGIVSPEMVYLDSGSHWFARFGDELLRFTLAVRHPSAWHVVSQGRATREPGGVTWEEQHPQDDIYLVGARFHLYKEATPHGEAQVYLREPDEALARRYLAATARYLDLYSRLIGPYPYAKFALIENAWETGLGMPSFTLLGPRVLRLPFIIDTSYPHEVLHNWWGNGVYLDYASGNWAEGLTTYLADHLLAERDGRGAAYRRGLLQKYADYVTGARDFPLREFRARHGEASQAVGYGKSVMLFHALRLRLGDETFLAGLRRFYERHRFTVAGFDDIRRAFEAASGRRLEAELAQWVDRTGAPALELADVRVTHDGEEFRVRGRMTQRQPGRPYRLRVPIAVQLAGRAPAHETVLHMPGRRLRFDLRFAERPLLLAVDPRFDLFRRLDPAELPPSLGRVYGAERGLIVLPGAAPAAVRRAYYALAESWARPAGFAIVEDTEIAALPDDRAVWLLGWENRFRPEVARRLADRGVEVDADGVRVDGRRYARAARSVALAAGGRNAVAWLGAPNAASVPALARKLPHYSRYGYLVFEGPEAANVLKGEWPVAESPLQVALSPERAQLELEPRSPLAAPKAQPSAISSPTAMRNSANTRFSSVTSSR